MWKSWKPSAALMVLGLVLILITIFANQIGLDHNASWGGGRITLLGLGIIAIITALVLYLRQEKTAYNTTQTQVGAGTKGLFILIGLCFLFVTGVYLWYVTVGYWTVWPKTTYAYDLLASAFQHGHVALEVQPDPALLALPDPYDPTTRGTISFLWDASLYRGKYYLYFGPVPALVLVGIKLILQRQIADQYLAFAFVVGLFIVNSLLIHSLWRRFFSSLPVWSLLLNIVFAGLASPAIWLLSRPAIYEAAIASSQFFLMAGFYFAYSTVEKPRDSNWRLLLVGICWSLAIGSRTTTAVPALFMLLTLLCWIHKTTRHVPVHRSWLPQLATLGIPPIVSTLALGVYNRIRFGSLTEFGLRYQLTWINLNKFHNQAFSLAYVPANIYNYFLLPFKLADRFPFLKSQFGQNPAFVNYVGPDIYRPEAVAGLLFAAPYLLFAVIPLAIACFGRARMLLAKDITETNEVAWHLAWVCTTLLGAAILAMVLLLLFFYSTMRYEEDVVPALTLLSAIGFWQGYRFLRERRWPRILYSIVSFGLAGFSIGVGALLAITGYEERFRHLNRPLLEQIIRFFSH